MGASPFSVAEQSMHFLQRRHDQPPSGPVRARAAWRASELGDVDRLKRNLSAREIAEFERAIMAARRTATDIDALTRADFPLSGLAGAIEGWRADLRRGRGFVLLSGVPVDRWSLADQHLFMRGLGLHFGRLGMQNGRGDVIGEVRNTGAATRDPFARNYVTDREFRFHCDAADLLGLLCIRKARAGGESRLASSVTVYNELLQRRPDLARRLFEPVLLDLRNEQAEGTAGYAEVTPCAYADGVLKTFYISDYFRSVDRHPEVSLPRADLELFDLYEEIAASPEVSLAFQLEPGDVQIVYNHTMLHARTAFEDSPGAERLLLRFLVSVDA